MSRWFFLACLCLNLGLQAKTLTYGQLETPTPTLSKPLSFSQMIEIMALKNTSIQNIALAQKIKIIHLQTEESLLNPHFSMGGSLQKNVNLDSNLPQLYVKSSWKNAYGSQIDLAINHQRDVSGEDKLMPSLDIVQPLLKGFGKTANTRSVRDAKDDLSLNSIDAEETFSKAIVELYDALAQYHVAREKILYTQEMLKVNTQQQHLRKKKIEAGEIAASEISVIDYSTQKMKIRLVEAENERLMILNKLSKLLGISITEQHIPQQLPTLKLDHIDTFSLQKLQSIAHQHAYASRRNTIALLKNKRSQAYMQNQSRISADVYLHTESWQKPTEYGLRVQIPLNDPLDHERQQIALLERNKLLIAQREFKLRIKEQCAQAQEHLVHAKQAAHFAKLSFIEAQKVYKTYRQKYAHQMVSSLELEKAFLDCYDSGIMQLEKEVAISKTKLQLLHEIGYLLPTLSITLEPIDA